MKNLSFSMLFVVVTSACTGNSDDACGLKSGKPDVADGTLEAQRDGSTYTSSSGLRGYKLLSNKTDIVAGDVTLNVGKDQDGKSVDTLINDGKFPICVPLNDQADGTTYALVNASNASYITDGTNTGIVAILGKDGDVLYGRFEFTAKKNGGSETTRFEDGSFKLGPR